MRKIPMIQVYEMRVQGPLLDYSGGSLSAREFDDVWEEDDDVINLDDV